MEILEVIVYIIIVGIYLLSPWGRNALRRRRRRRYYGLFGEEYSPLEDIRAAYDTRLKVYYEDNKPTSYLINSFCELRLINKNNGRSMSFYCKQRTNGRTRGSYFEVVGNTEHVATMWAIINMEFSLYSNYDDIRSLYMNLNSGYNTTGGLRYFREPVLGKKLPKGEMNRFAQNEFCKMEIQILPSGEKILLCSEIWGEPIWNKQRSFIIMGKTPILYGILSEFEKDRNTMVKYTHLLYKYSARVDCKIKEVNSAQKQEELSYEKKNNTVSKTNNQLHAEIKEEPDAIPYIHVDIEPEEPQKRKKLEPSQEDDVIDLEKPPIEKFDERHLDF